VDEEEERLGLLLREALEPRREALLRAALLLTAREVVVEDELVAVVDEEVGRALLHAEPDHVLVVLAQLRDERREVAVAREDHERVEVRLRVAEVHGIDDEPDVRAVLAADVALRDLDQLDRRL